jgi:hypothetical protein
MKEIGYAFILCLLVLTVSCDSTTDSSIEEGTITVSIKNSETYKYRTGISGDEEGASIILQAENSVISEIVRNAETNWEAVYTYRAKPFFSGTDLVEIELSTGSDGASPPTSSKIVRLRIHVD